MDMFQPIKDSMRVLTKQIESVVPELCQRERNELSKLMLAHMGEIANLGMFMTNPAEIKNVG